MLMMKNILLVPNKNKDINFVISKKVAELISGGGATVYTEAPISELSDISRVYGDSVSLDLIIVIGGDGSILDSSRLAIEKSVPILGVNLGKVGYLSEVDVENLGSLNKLFSGEYSVDDKMLLEVAYVSGEEIEISERLALNDVIIGHDTFLGIADFRLKKSDSETVRYRADGIIFSTPVGSTAYSLSAGGPIVAHDIDSILVTPIAPHSFFNRSIIFNSEECLEVVNNGETELNVSIDGRFFKTLNEGDKCTVRKSEKRLKVLTFNKSNMFSTLFKKMKIMEDVK